MPPKPFGKPSGSLNAPIAAFSMALVLASYCISSINTARREAQSSPDSLLSRQKPSTDKMPQQAWIQQALEESREADKRNSKK